MKIIKPTPLGVLTRPYRAAGSEHLGVAIPMMVTLGEAPRLVSESELWDTVGAELAGFPLDAALPKPRAEFLLSARAYGRYCDHTNTCRVGIRFAGVEKALLVSGERRWAGSAPSAAEPFESLAIDWPLAFGGAGYADNPRGRGFHGVSANSERSQQQLSQPLPNVEYPAERLRRPGQIVTPGSFTPIAADWPQRRALYGALDAQWRESDCPGFPRSMDTRYFNIAPTDQQFPALDAMPDGAAYRIVHMHPEQPVMTGALPPLRARCFLQRQSEDTLAEIRMRLTTVWFIPHRERAIMIFHGIAGIREFDAHDVACLLLGAELSGEPRSAADYRRTFDRRMDRKHGALHALRDQDLAPPTLLITADDASTDATSHDALERNLQQRARQQIERARAAGLAPGAFDAAPTQPPRIDQLAEFVEQQERIAQEQRAALEEKQREIEARHAASGMRKRVNPPTTRRGPPALSRDGAASRRADRKKDPRHLEIDADKKLRETYRHAVQYQEAAPRLDTAAGRVLQERVAAAHARGESLAGWDLTGADLSRMSLRGATLSGALLESADLSDTDLTGAVLGNAVLARATLVRTVFARTDLTGANLSLAQCDGTDFSDAVLDRALFENTRFERCRLTRASVQRTQFRDCRFLSTDFSEATLSDLAFIEQTFDAVDFSRASIRKLAFIQCTLTRVAFASADIAGFGFVETVASGIRFDGAILRKACFVKESVLDNADFSQAQLSEVNLRQVRAHGANFSGARIDQCDFSDARMRLADLRGAKIADSHLVRTDLSGANLARADLMGASMRRAVLHGANFREANLFRADFAEAAIDDTTQFDGAYLDQANFHPFAKAAA